MKTYNSLRKWFTTFSDTFEYSLALQFAWENGYETESHFVLVHEKCDEVIQFVYWIKGASSAEGHYNELTKKEWYCTLSKLYPLVLKIKELGLKCPKIKHPELADLQS
ncbi:hypothetical protein [Bacillus manliponensis]|uniref:hypothetical protein n=1 Tax=Bacillus manliponensis TaxID=574376 RepID=UPI00190FB347|nr:hypothetical protein [Bacillus manliponensis]